MKVGVWAFCCFASVVCMCYAWGEEDVRYGVGAWSAEGLGNHRAVVRVNAKAEAVWVHIPWRRRALRPEAKAVLVFDASTHQQVKNAVTLTVNREFGDLVFEPQTAPGEYLVYYMPYTVSGLTYSPTVTYTPPHATADPVWLRRHQLMPEGINEGAWKSLPRAELVELQARSEFHRFDPMEVIATGQEMKQLLAQNSTSPYLLFPEDRKYPIRMTDDLPLRWIRKGPANEFHG